jgi:hypothetical protein
LASGLGSASLVRQDPVVVLADKASTIILVTWIAGGAIFVMAVVSFVHMVWRFFRDDEEWEAGGSIGKQLLPGRRDASRRR